MEAEYTLRIVYKNLIRILSKIFLGKVFKVVLMVYADKTRSSNEVSNHSRYTRLNQTQSVIEESFLEKVNKETKKLESADANVPPRQQEAVSEGQISVISRSSLSVPLEDNEELLLQQTIQKALSAYKENQELTATRDWSMRGNFA